MVKITKDSIDLSANLQQFSKMPVTGLISLWTGISIPANTLLCDGKEYNIADYPGLASFLGTASATKFSVPNLNGRFSLGADNSSTITNGGVMVGGSSQINSIEHSHTANISMICKNVAELSNPEIGNGGGWNYIISAGETTLTTDSNTPLSKIDYLPEYTVVRYIIHT